MLFEQPTLITYLTTV